MQGTNQHVRSNWGLGMGSQGGIEPATLRLPDDCSYLLSHIAHRSFLDKLNTLLSLFPEDDTPLILLGDFNIHLEASHSAAFLPLIHSFDLSLQSFPPTHKAGNLLDLVFVRNCSPSNPTVTPLHISDHHFISFSIPLATPLLPTLSQSAAVTSTLSHPPLLPPKSLLLSLLLNLSLISPLILPLLFCT